MGLCQSKIIDLPDSASPTIIIPQSPHNIDVLSYRFKHGEFKGVSIRTLLETKNGIEYLIELKKNVQTTQYMKHKIRHAARLYYNEIFQLVK